MENSWQSKCGSFWQQSQPPPSLVASSLLDSHTQESMLLTSGMIHEHMLSNMHGLDNSGHAGLGASFLSLVSGPSSHVPCDEQHQLDPKPVSGPNLVSSNCRTADGFCGGSKVSVIPGAFLPNLTTRDAFCPLTSSNSNVYCSNSSAVLQATNLNFQKSPAVACHNIHEKDKAKSSSQVGNNNTNSVSANSWKLLKYAHTTSLHVENNISAYHHDFNPSSSSLRVFCSGTSGNLLLSDAGLLGVVCTCHGLYMSISKFSEHSGSCDVNPGYAVRMDNGQTLAHWWKTFFSKTGIRVLEGQSGWDWPEGISFASGLTNHPIASTSNSPALLNQVSPLKASVSCGQKMFSMLNTKDNQSCRNIVDKNTIFERDRTSQECSNSIFKYFMNSCHGNLQHAAGQPQCGLPNLFTAHTERASQSSKLDFICGGSANSFPALPNTQNLNTPCNGRSVGTETSFIVNRPGVSSNIELRLGQPRGQIQTLETKFQPAFGSELNGMHAKSSKVFFPDKLLQKTGNELQGGGWTLQYADIASCTPERRGSTQLGHSCNVGGAYGAKTDCQKDPLSVSLEMTNANPLLLSCFKNPGTKEQSVTAINSNANEKLHCKSYASGSEKICHPWSSVAATFNGFSMNVTNAQVNVNKGKKVECSLNGLLGAAKSNTEFSKAFKEDKRKFNSVLGETSSNYSSAFHEKRLKPELMPAMVVDESYSRHILNSCSKISSLSNIMHFNHDRVKPIQNSTPSKETPMGFSSKNSVFVRNATPTLLKEKPCGIKKGLHYENVEVPSVWNMLERSNGESCPASLRSLQECETIKNPYVQSPLTIVPSISKDHSNLLDSSRMPKIPEFGERPTLSGTICWMDHNSEGFGTVTGGSLHAEDPNLPPVEQLFVRPRGPECNFTRSKKEHGSQDLPYAFVPEKCSSAAQENCLEGKQVLIGENCCNLVKQGGRNGADTNLLHSKLKENWKDIAKSFEKTESSVTTDVKNSEFRSFEWRDVPKKIMGSCGSTRKDQQVGSYNRPVPAADVSKCFAGFALNVVPLKEQEISNISSGCSAPDVTQSSIEVSKNDSSTVEGGNIKATNKLVLDEGSGNDRSWSADGALDNECTDFFGSSSFINLTKREPSKVFPRKRSLSLIEEIRLQNSLRSKNSPYKMKRSSAIQEESDRLPKFELGPTKRRKTVKWMKLDIPVLVSGQSSINNGSPKCTEEVEQSSHSFWEMQMPDGNDRRSLSICADAIVQSSKQRKSASSAAKGISQRKNLHKVYYQLEQQTTEAHKSSVVNDTLNGSVILSKKRLRLDDASAPCKEIQEVCCNSSELTAKLTSFGGISNSLGKPKFFKWVTRPTVFGKYGIISNGNPLKPAKIISLRKVLENASSHSAKSNRNADNNEKLISTSVKVKKMSVRHVKETILSKKVLKSQVSKGGTENLHPIESECCGRNEDIEIASCSTTNGSDNLSYTLQKCNNHGITERKPGVQLKTKFKEGRKRSLHELLTKGNGFKVVNSSVSCQTASRCCGELMEKAVKGRAQRNEMNNAMRCSEKHQPEYSDMFCCVCGGSDKDGYSPLLQCNRLFIKGLRNEAEAVDPEKVSLYGRCMPCAISQDSDGESLQPGEKFLICARTEGYKGRKREGFLHNCPQDTDGNGGCLVPQEQLNAWLHIHRQKPQRKGHPALSTSNVESDCRKAYARYKQSKSWKHLVVYKSRIHALGLYTSQFISRGAMVVEYVGEIVGLRVADRREKEYHSGKKIQHKSACYFFRIDKEHIIDATRKGGIARFVNHSCQPNCAAKVISVRTGKKVVFFAERDIYPGEEITYDYHFNHEDEGQKIPCYCNSKNCRRYLN